MHDLSDAQIKPNIVKAALAELRRIHAGLSAKIIRLDRAAPAAAIT